MAKDLVIDLSHWNDPVDFEEVRSSGIVGIIHKATEGGSYVDDMYHERKVQAQDAGLLWGAYHFMRPGDQRAHANHFYNTVGDIDVYAADHEDSGVSLDDLKDWLTEMEDLTGKKPVVYSGHVIKEQLGNDNDPFLSEHRLWLAHYSGTPSWPEGVWDTYWLWQYTDQGENDGVGGYCDLNKYQGSADQLAQEWVGAEAPPAPEPEPTPEPVASEVKITITVRVKGAHVTVTTK